MSHILLIESTTTQPAALARAAVAAGHTVTWLMRDLADYRLRPGDLPAGVTVVTGTDTVDPGRASTAALDVHRDCPVHACLTTSEGHLPAAAAAATALGLRHEPPERVALLRDKERVRAALAARGVRQPAWHPAATVADLPAALAATGLPAVVKPVDGSGSIGVAVVATGEAAREALEDVTGRSTFGRGLPSARRALVERFVPGELVSVEVFSRDGRHLPLAVTTKKVGGRSGAVELGGTLIPVPPGDIAGCGYGAAVTVALESLDALGFRDGASHVEVIAGPDGPRLIEVNGRIAGGPVPAALDLVLDRPVLTALLDLHLGTPGPPPRPVAAAAVGALTAPEAGRLTVFDPDALVTDGAADVVLTERRPGDLVRPPHSNRDRLGFVACRGDSPHQAEARLARALARVRIEVAPAPPHPPAGLGGEVAGESARRIGWDERSGRR